MPHFMNQHDPKPGLQEVRLTDAQFEKIVELLTPGYEMGKLYLASMTPKTESLEPPAPLDE